MPRPLDEGEGHNTETNMKYQCAYTTEAGVTIALVISASSASVQLDLGADAPPSEAEDLARSAFCRTLPELSRLLEPVVVQVESILQSSYVEILKSLVEQENALPLDTPRDTAGEQCRECTGDGASETIPSWREEP